MLSIGIKELLESGVHFGHQTRRWNPKMKPFIFDARNGIHIIDLSKTLAQFEAACDFLAETVRKGGKVLFVGTKKQAQQCVKETAKETGQFHVTERWLGGTLTNFNTIKSSIKRLKEIEKMDRRRHAGQITANRSNPPSAARPAGCTSISMASARWTGFPPRCSLWTSNANTMPWPRRASSRFPLVAHRGHQLRSRSGELSHCCQRRCHPFRAHDSGHHRPGDHTGAGGIRIQTSAPYGGRNRSG